MPLPARPCACLQSQQELADAQAQLSKLRAEREGEQARAAEDTATIARLKLQLTSLMKAGQMTLAEEHELEVRLSDVIKVSDRQQLGGGRGQGLLSLLRATVNTGVEFRGIEGNGLRFRGTSNSNMDPVVHCQQSLNPTLDH